MLEGLTLLLDVEILLWIMVGIVVSTVIAVIPGLSGVFAVVILLPLAFSLDPIHAIAMLLAANIVSGTANTITSVLIGIPGSTTAIATIIDGYPMAKRGEGARAIAAGLMASALGGFFGGFVLAAALPIIRPIVLHLGPAEYMIIVVGTLIAMGAMAPGNGLKVLMSSALGLLASTVGLHQGTATERFTFGELYLWDGLGVIPVMIGLFALAEMVQLAAKGESIAEIVDKNMSEWSKMKQGIVDVFVRWRLVLQSSVVGVVAGIAPGIGGTAGQFMAYSQATRTLPVKDKEGRRFGEGRVDGVIGADAATNAVEGGTLIPGLALGIPGSVPMAILISVFVALGINPGPSLLAERQDLIWMIIGLLILSNIIATTFTLSLVPLLSKIAYVPAEYIVPPVLVLSMVGAYSSTNQPADVIVAMAFAFVGLALIKLNLSRVPFVIGFVLGPLAERYLLLTRDLYGWSFILRPGVLSISAVLIVMALYRPVKQGIKELSRTKSARQ